MSEMLERSFNEFYQQVTPEILAEKKRLFDEYMGRQYKGKPWRRLSNEEIVALEDKELLEQIESLGKLGTKPLQPDDDTDDIVVKDGVVVSSSDPKEVTGNQEFVIGHGGDIGGPDGRAYNTEEDWANLDIEIENERKRIYRLVTSPPRTGKYLAIFKKKFPNRTEKELMEGFVLSENGKHSQDYTDWMARQEATHKRAGSNRLEHAEVARREAIAPENTDALAYGDPNSTMAIHREVLGNSIAGASDHLDKHMAVGRRASTIAKYKFDVADDDGFVPEEDLIDPERYRLNGDAIEMPVDELTQQQRDSLKITEVVRNVPPREVANG